MPRIDHWDVEHGVRFNDPYRHLEDPSPDVMAWERALDERAERRLRALPAADWSARFLEEVGPAEAQADASRPAQETAPSPTGETDVAEILFDTSPRGRLVAGRRELVPASDRVLRSVSLAGERLIVLASDHGRDSVLVLERDGRLVHDVRTDGGITPGGIGHGPDAKGFPARLHRDRLDFVLESPLASPAPVALDLRTGVLVRKAPPAHTVPGAVAERHWAVTPDTARLCIDVVRPAGTSSPLPTMVYGYGSLGRTLDLNWTPAAAAVLACGGAFAFAHVRGGGEYGIADAAWHRTTTPLTTTADDLVTLTELLVDQGVADRDRLVFVGASAGGTLGSAVVVRRPGLFRALVLGAPMVDAIRFAQLVDRGWDGLGSLQDAESTRALVNALPYLNLPDGLRRPHLLVGCGRDDVVCPPWHARKLVAALAHAGSTGSGELLLRSWPGDHLACFSAIGGPPAGGECLAFALHHLGLEPPKDPT